jgi:hypothetical protein
MIKQKKIILKKKNKMKKILIITSMVMTFIFSPSYASNECESALSKLKPSCNILGTGIKKMKEFSSKNQTIGQSLGIEKNKDGSKKNKKTLREISAEHKTINQTIEKFNNKPKK